MKPFRNQRWKRYDHRLIRVPCHHESHLSAARSWRFKLRQSNFSYRSVWVSSRFNRRTCEQDARARNWGGTTKSRDKGVHLGQHARFWAQRGYFVPYKKKQWWSNNDGEFGFVSEIRRINVSLSRARYLNMIIGDFNCVNLSQQHQLSIELLYKSLKIYEFQWILLCFIRIHLTCKSGSIVPFFFNFKIKIISLLIKDRWS